MNVVTSSRSGSTMSLISHLHSRKLTFTGLPAVERWLMEPTSKNLLRVSMKLAGNGLFLILEDADLEDAVAGASVAKMRNIGGPAMAANRLHAVGSVAKRSPRDSSGEWIS